MCRNATNASTRTRKAMQYRPPAPSCSRAHLAPCIPNGGRRLAWVWAATTPASTSRGLLPQTMVVDMSVERVTSITKARTPRRSCAKELPDARRFGRRWQWGRHERPEMPHPCCRPSGSRRWGMPLHIRRANPAWLGRRLTATGRRSGAERHRIKHPTCVQRRGRHGAWRSHSHSHAIDA